MSSGVFKIARSFTVNVTLSSSTWVISHMLGYKPTVDVFLNLGAGIEKVIPGQIVHTDNNNLTIYFSAPHVGKVICN